MRTCSLVKLVILGPLVVDPDYPLARTLQTWAGSAGLWLKQRIGGFFYYTLIFDR